jgi:hypothetical protein
MPDEMKPFLEEGIQRYAEAKDTITAFENAMCQLLRSAIESRSWSPLKNSEVGRPRPGGTGGKDGYWIATSISGTSPKNEETEIDCGLWWNAPGRSGPIIYTSFYHKPERLVRFQWKGGQDISSFDGRNRTFLYVPVPNPLAIEGPINTILDALLARLG